MLRSGILMAVSALVGALPALAHEVWIEPVSWQIEVDETVSAHLLNGQELSGIQLSWDPKSIALAQSWTTGTSQDLDGRFGDVPAFSATANSEGLLSLVYQSEPKTLTYPDFETFTGFLDEKGWSGILEQHDARGLPKSQVKETYSRFAKTLIAVGDATGADAPRGMELELVALDNPYLAATDDALRFQLIYQGVPLPDNRVTLFERAPDGAVRLSHQQTDAEGIASFDTNRGHMYLVDSVVVRQPSRDMFIETRGALWESLWASLTFKQPAKD